MKLHILSGFETRSYSTNTIFYSDTIERAEALTLKFAQWLIDNYDKRYDDSNDSLIIDSFSNQIWYACSETNNISNITIEKLFKELKKSIRSVDMNTLLFDESQIDGD
jgi:hypothetical protein